MVLSINALAEPVGSIKSWIRPSAATPLPGGWLICDGSTVVDSSSVFNGLAIPDLRSRFPRGHATLTNANFGADTFYYTGGTIPTGGADTVNLSHGHSSPSHAHSSPSHAHAVPSDSGHSHSFSTGGAVQPGPGGTSSYQGGAFTHFHSGTTSPAGTHSHGGATSTATAVVDGTNVSINSSLGSTENQPPFNDLLLLIKIK